MSILKFKNFLPFLDFGVIPVGQNPLYLLWMTRLGVGMAMIFVILIIPSVLEYRSDKIDTLTIIDRSLLYITLAQFLLILALYKYDLKLGQNYFYFLLIFYISIFLLTVLFPNWKSYINISNRGFLGYRFSAFSSEPSYFAEIILMFFLLLYFSNKKVSAVVFIFVIGTMSQSKTIINYFLLNIIILMLLRPIFYKKYVRLSGRDLIFIIICVLWGVGILLSSNIGIKIAVFQHEELNSWRLISNVLALQNTQYVPVSDYRDVVYSASIEHVSWMKYAVWSFIPYISINVGYFLLMLIIIVIAMGLMLTMKNYIGRFTCFEISSILTIVIHVMYFSPKWNLAPMIGLILLLQQKRRHT